MIFLQYFKVHRENWTLNAEAWHKDSDPNWPHSPKQTRFSQLFNREDCCFNAVGHSCWPGRHFPFFASITKANYSWSWKNATSWGWELNLSSITEKKQTEMWMYSSALSGRFSFQLKEGGTHRPLEIIRDSLQL